MNTQPIFAGYTQRLFASLALQLLTSTNGEIKVAKPDSTHGQQNDALLYMRRELSYVLDYGTLQHGIGQTLAVRNEAQAHTMGDYEPDVDGVQMVQFLFTYGKKPGGDFLELLLRADGNLILTHYAPSAVNGYDRKIGELYIPYFSNATERQLAQVVHERNGAIRQAAINRATARANSRPAASAKGLKAASKPAKALKQAPSQPAALPPSKPTGSGLLLG